MEANNKTKVGISADHAGYQLKEVIKKNFEENLEFIDFGTHNDESMDYPDVAHPLAKAVLDKKVEWGIAICGSGNGINMTVNKYAGIRSALCWREDIAELARQHNDANILSIPARFISDEMALDIVEAFSTFEFEGGRHQRRVDKI
ncbi:MAG: ribose 5-phosphate isomerase B [Cryomorphaceae bacterium]|nr:ribose 5-phosphate isomerase B [Cryomorphaceae bacterium]